MARVKQQQVFNYHCTHSYLNSSGKGCISVGLKVKECYVILVRDIEPMTSKE